MPSLTPLCTINAKLSFQMIGQTPIGTRINIPFTGTATSEHWEGEWPVNGVDYVTVRADGTMALEIRATIGEGKGLIAYSATGVSRKGEAEGEMIPQELLTFETSNPDFAYLNESVAVAIGSGSGADLSLDVQLVSP